MDSEKCWRRRLRRTIEAGTRLLPLVLLAASVSAANEPPAVAALDNFLERVETLSADFDQQVFSPDEELLEEAHGTFALARPDRFVWNYETPIKQIVLADGDELWMYDVELEQATVSPIEEGAGSPAMLLSGGAAVLDNFEVESTWSRDGRDWVKLIPKLEGTDFSAVSIGFDAEAVPRELELVDGLEQTTHIEFTNIVINRPLDDGVFELDLPDDVDVIGRDG